MVIVAEEIARVSADLVMAYTRGIFCGLNLVRMASEEQKRLPAEISCRQTEFSRSPCRKPTPAPNIGAMRSTAVKDGNEWVIHGQKLWASTAVPAKTAPLKSRRRGTHRNAAPPPRHVIVPGRQLQHARGPHLVQAAAAPGRRLRHLRLWTSSVSSQSARAARPPDPRWRGGLHRADGRPGPAGRGATSSAGYAGVAQAAVDGGGSTWRRINSSAALLQEPSDRPHARRHADRGSRPRAH